jgi:hypothetical protein
MEEKSFRMAVHFGKSAYVVFVRDRQFASGDRNISISVKDPRLAHITGCLMDRVASNICGISEDDVRRYAVRMSSHRDGRMWESVGL